MTPENQAARQDRIHVLESRSNKAHLVVMVSLLVMAVANGVVNYRQQQTINDLRLQVNDAKMDLFALQMKLIQEKTDDHR